MKMYQLCNTSMHSKYHCKFITLCELNSAVQLLIILRKRRGKVI